MKKETSALDLHFILNEMQFLQGARVDKIYQDKKNMSISVHVPSKGKNIINIFAPNFMFISSNKPGYPQTPKGFCMFLRKYLKNARIISIKQHGFERIVDIEFETKDAKYIMIIELFSKGNIILAKEDYTIMSAQESQRLGQRTVRGGIKYEYPKREYDISNITEEQLLHIFKNTKIESIVKALAIELGLGGVYSEEILYNAKIDKNTLPKKANHKLIFSWITALLNKKAKPIVSANGEIYPFKLNTKEIEGQYFNMLNAAIDSTIMPLFKDNKKNEIISKHEKKVDKAKEIIRRQKKQIKLMEESYIEYQKKGELIYQNYQLIEDILEQLKKARKTLSWKEISKKLKGHKVVKQIDEKNSKITIEI